MKIRLSAIERDILKEIINIGLAKAADALSVIAGIRVMLQAPSVEIVEPEQLPELLQPHSHHELVVQSDLKGDVEGKTFLSFSPVQATILAHACLGPEDCYQGNYAVMRRSLLLEVANILTGSLSTLLADIFRLHIYGTPPAVMTYSMQEARKNYLSDITVFEPFTLAISTQFIQAGMLLELPLLIIFDLSSVESMLTIIRKNTAASYNWLAR